ncbi:MAG: hypothetical protein KatS3mg002_0753 [Candidatus Woesearchaeota archaeon]|nr:MAG: hypothetical protein KatS3mg002_0753 [Candidatus Woesearchaeota archaeon]
MGLKIKKTEDIGYSIRRIVWPNIDDAAQLLYEKTKDKDSIDLKIQPYIYSYARKAITIGIIALLTYYTTNYLGNNYNKKTNNKEIINNH